DWSSDVCSSDLDQRTRLVEDPGLRPGEPGKTTIRGVGPDVGAGVECVQQLQGAYPAPGFLADHRAARARSEAVRIAAAAASRPLLPAAPPERAAACSTLSQVSNPNPTGTRVSVATLASAAEVSPATKSKCGVSPRITIPRVTIAA